MITKAQMNHCFIGTRSINIWINHHIIITIFLRQTDNNSFRNFLWYPTEVNSRVWKIQFIFINWSIYWCWFYTEINSSTCVCVILNIFWTNYWSKLSWWTICSINKYNITFLNFFIIEIWISSQPRYHEYSIIIKY